MSRKKQLPRRTFLRGMGTAMALPMLEAMRPLAFAAEHADTAFPIRTAFIFFPNGAIMPNWKPEGEGPNWELSRTLQPLTAHKDQLTVFTGLTQHHGRANGDGAGDHARCASSFLTGAQPVKTAGADIRVGMSIDQAIADGIGNRTKLPSLELGVDRSRNGGNCDSGYSCAYSSNVSWKTPTTPMAKEINPKLAFERLFGSSGKANQRYRKSILDMVAEDAALLRKRLGKTDRRKLDEYLTSVRELEQRIDREATTADEVPDYQVPEGIPRETATHIRLMYDIMTLAFQTDSTRVSTFMLANAGSNRSYRMVGVDGGHHSLSHHRNDPNKIEDLSRIDEFLSSQFAYFLDKLKAVEEGDGTLLDNCLVLYGSGIADANRHTHHDLPIVLAGSGGGKLETGRLRHYPKDTPLNNLFVSMGQIAGAPLETLGDSTGTLDGLSAT
ncbi:MAG: DUF1552 domain-containing protein [Planctomycetales bacterium]|nr:DUF1552 domain-containing protein [Planctomycetales bacterium]